MKNRIRTQRWYPALLLGIVLAVLVVMGALAAGSVDPTNLWAWGAFIGWINFSPTHGGVTVTSDHLEGSVWGENIGWIRLGTHEGGGAHTYANDAAGTYGVNRDSSGVLSGYAWGTNVGWINFGPNHGGVTIDPQTGAFDGYAWGENVGWIRVRGAGYVVNESAVYLPVIVRPPTAPTPPTTRLSISNRTSAALTRYTVYGTPQGDITCRDIPSGATRSCGSFAPGRYRAEVVAPACGTPTFSGMVDYAAGEVTREVRCVQ